MRRRRQLVDYFLRQGALCQWGRKADVRWDQEVPRLNVHEVHVHFQMGRHGKVYQVPFERFGQMSLAEAVARTIPLNKGITLRHIVLGCQNERKQWLRIFYPVGGRWGHDASAEELLELRKKLHDQAIAQVVRQRNKRTRRRVSLRKRIAGALLGRSSANTAHAHT